MKNKINTLVALTNTFVSQTAGIMGTLTGQHKKIATSLMNSVKPLAKKLNKLSKATPTQAKATKASASIPATKPGTAKATATAKTNIVDNLKPLFAQNHGKPMVYTVQSRAQFRTMRLLLATVATYGYECAIGMKAHKLQVVVAPKGAPIPKQFFVKGFQYPSAIKAGGVIGIDGSLQASKAGKNLLHAVKHIQGTKALVSIEPTATTVQTASTNGTKPTASMVKNPLHPDKFKKSEKPVTTAVS